jgi:competence protein ComEA
MKTVMLFLMLFSVNIFAAPVNVNRASAEEISEALKGIGMKKAVAIVKYRKDNGAFSSIDELTNVKGIGLKTVAANRGDIKLGKKKKARKSKK